MHDTVTYVDVDILSIFFREKYDAVLMVPLYILILTVTKPVSSFLFMN